MVLCKEWRGKRDDHGYGNLVSGNLDDSGEDVGYEYEEKILQELEACDSHEKMED